MRAAICASDAPFPDTEAIKLRHALGKRAAVGGGPS
jgi:hypothetical protein